MCNILGGYFRVNGSIIYETYCSIKTTDVLNVECLASFPPAEIGKQYKAELKIKLPTGADFSFFTPLKTVSTQTETFTSDNFITPLPTGTYAMVWFVIYDSAGNTICAADGRTGTTCKSVTVSTTLPVPDNGILVNNQQNITVVSGTNITVNARMSSGAGKQWRVIAISGSPLGLSDVRISVGTLILDANGYGSTTIRLVAPGQYTLVGRWCNEWVDEAHCILYDSDTSRASVIVEPAPPPPPSQFQCSPACTIDQLCIIGKCVPKNTLVIAAVAFIGLMMLTGD